MQIRGFVKIAALEEVEPGGDRVELWLGLQGVGRDQPRKVVVPFELLVADATIDPDDVAGRGFAAEVEQDATGRWVVSTLELAARVLRPAE